MSCNYGQIELLGFLDTSQEAYGACIFVRSKEHDGQWHAFLMCLKSWAAPLKEATVPRVEQGAACVLALLVVKVASSWEFEV